MFIMITSCESNSSDDVEDPNLSIPSQEPPTEQFIVNMSVADVGEEAGIFGCHKLPWGGETLYRNAHSLDDEAFFAVLGNNYNVDGTFPTRTGDDFARPGSETSRNNTGITFVLADDTNANAEIVVSKTFDIEFRGVVGLSCGDTAFEITQFDFKFRALEPNSEVLGPFEEITYHQEEFINISVGNIFVDIDGVDTDVTRFRDLAAQTQNPIKIKILETIIVENGERTIYQPDL